MNREGLIECGLDIIQSTEYNRLRERFEEWKRNVLRHMEDEKIETTSCRMNLHVVEVPFVTDEEKKEAYISAIRKTINYLGDLSTGQSDVRPLETMISNFDLYLQNMYERLPENKATLTKDVLEQIVINNEYDLQHIMYAIVKTLYPSARREVNQDMGYGTVRFDIAVEEIDTVIELKCTRKDHNENKLCRELGEDAFFYKCSNLIIYVYDKEHVISDATNFVKALERTKEAAGKEIRVIVTQKKELI